MKKPWGGRFSRRTDPEVEKFSASIHFDCRLAEEDIEGSLAHVDALAAAGIITPEEAAAISAGLEEIRAEILAGKFEPDPSYEDIHMYIESRLREKIGDAGGKLHTGRSRNDQVALDMHLYMKKEIKAIDFLLYELQKTIIDLAAEHTGTLMPGYTHLQRAQPVRFAHHLLAYFWMFQRDRERLRGAYRRADIMSLGAGALAGSGFPLDRARVAERLGFTQLYENSMDAVSDRDYLLEFLSFASICIMHLSRIGEELVIWSSSEFGFVEMDDAFATGSSLMPQKKNPDIAELVRGKTGRVFGSLVGLLTTMKGLPLCYNRDMQEDKEGVFDTIDTLKPALVLTREMLRTARINKAGMEEAIKDATTMATDIADYLVAIGVPFRDSHHLVGQMVAYSRAQGKSLAGLTTDELHRFHPSLDVDKLKALVDPHKSTEARSIRGGVSSAALKKQLAAARKTISPAL
ncbi:MAG: argininosuccinate lyase [Dethiobacteria bacterium]